MDTHHRGSRRSTGLNSTRLEADAESIYTYHPGLITGLLQTGACAREVIAATAITRTSEEVSALIEIRKTRQAILTTRQGGPLRLWTVINEGALHQRSASQPTMMRDQLRHLLDMADLPNITIQVMPLDATPHPGVAGPFEVVRFPQPWPTVVQRRKYSRRHLRGGHG